MQPGVSHWCSVSMLILFFLFSINSVFIYATMAEDSWMTAWWQRLLVAISHFIMIVCGFILSLWVLTGSGFCKTIHIHT